MIKKLFLKFIDDPLGFIKLAFRKAIIQPLKYKNKSGYDAQKYWGDRFSKYGLSLKSAGDEGLSEEKNINQYEEAGRVFLQFCEEKNIELSQKSILEIGCGTGFYTKILNDIGVEKYRGIDITDVLFPDLEKRFPGFAFEQKDITSERLNATFDLVLMIDVIEHIISEEKLSSCMSNINEMLNPKGKFILSPITEHNKKHHFHNRSWTLDDITSRLPNFEVIEARPFRDAKLVLFKKSE